MRDFATLYARLDSTTRTGEKVAALAEFFRTAPEADRLWTIALFSGRRPRRAVNATKMREWAAEASGLPLWLVEESYAVAGDLSETIALILPPPSQELDLPLAHWMDRLARLAALPEPERREALLEMWDSLPPFERFLFNKLLTGSFRVGISQTLVVRAVAQAEGLPDTEVAHRLMGTWTPATTTWAALLREGNAADDGARPYPFFLAYPLEDPADLGDPRDWFAERKWDGIRGQLILRGGRHHLWSRGEDLVTDRFPEIARALDWLPPGTVLDGEILAWRDGRPLPFAALQTRIGRKTLSRATLEAAPVILMAYDLLEEGGADIRPLPFAERRARLDALLAPLPPDAPLRLSPAVPFETLDDLARSREAAREEGAEGLMLKRLASPYGTGRRKGDWWKWKVEPFSVDAVMVYAQAGSGRRANLFTDFTFAVRDGDALVPFTKAYSGLTDEEFRQITAWVHRHTIQRFGPVRQVEPVQVFEIGFEGIQASPRHKSGVALRFPRMLRWRRDKPASEIDTLESLRALLRQQEAGFRPAAPSPMEDGPTRGEHDAASVP
ncbi:ATP-dependent DNA ligase [Rubellimicrobium sp. CFH 75288]|uniref:ATP-dependent DNA ligase n=1 Tax=Rubellimicrobium sp. CFH 75288 TaxID=2697034 RepID=UPI00141300F3|nr:ATP-dependent DNA ligase [Rubellimicrobium sp. CFH 75288]NAZ37465.1 ATP-dependent DNA ligase [Rubellimicrobium sp. CFH 75288]